MFIWYAGLVVIAVCTLIMLKGAVVGVARDLYEGICDRLHDGK